MKGIQRILVLMVLLLLCVPCVSALAEEAESPIDLYVFLWDRCGGCGVDIPGCGECRDTERFHLSIKQQLADRLYDGTITYRMLNCRYEEFREEFDAFSAAYGVAEEWSNVLPCVFIGRDGAGVYMTGEEAIADIAEILQAYESGEDLEALQQRIFDRALERANTAEEAE